jgi:hypothetical protein
MKKLILKSGLFRKSNINSEVGGELNITSWIKRLLSYLNITYADPCCPTDFSPARYNNDTNELENYNQTTNSWESSTIPYLPLVGGEMIDDASISWENGQYISKGSTDTGLGGDGGISLFCSVGYELNWQAGVLTNFQGANNVQPIKLGSNLQFKPDGYIVAFNEVPSIAVDERRLHDASGVVRLSWGSGLSYKTDMGNSVYFDANNKLIRLGDFDRDGQGTYLDVSDPDQAITLKSSNISSNRFNLLAQHSESLVFSNEAGNYFSADCSSGEQRIVIGDFLVYQNGTHIDIDDSHQKILIKNGSLNILNGLNIATGIAPASSTAPGTEGDVIFTDDAIYRCIATDTWKRTPLTTW